MRKVFISYARQNKRDVDELVEHLRVLGCDAWHDSSLHGGQDWWEEILRRIADCETFIAVISRDALNSTACRREFDWAESLKKPVLPVAVEPPTKALPRRFSTRQIVDYSNPEARDRAALMLAGGLAASSAAPPLPDPLPAPPAVPLSYLTDLIDLVTEPTVLAHEQQRHVLNQLEPALHSIDPEERQGGRDILAMLSSRDDLYADVYRTIDRLKDLGDGHTSARGHGHATGRSPGSAEVSAPPQHATAGPANTNPSALKQGIAGLFRSRVGPHGRWRAKHAVVAVAVTLIAIAAIVGLALHNRAGRPLYPGYILAPKPGLTGANVYTEPKSTSAPAGELPVGTVVYIVCVAIGDEVEGPGPLGQPRIHTPVWDKVRREVNGRDLGYVPDVWVNTGGTEVHGPYC